MIAVYFGIFTSASNLKMLPVTCPYYISKVFQHFSNIKRMIFLLTTLAYSLHIYQFRSLPTFNRKTFLFKKNFTCVLNKYKRERKIFSTIYIPNKHRFMFEVQLLSKSSYLPSLAGD